MELSDKMLLWNVLLAVSDHDLIDTLTLAKMLHEENEKIVSLLGKTELKKDELKMDPIRRFILKLTQEGKIIMKYGSPEVILFNAIPEGGIDKDELFSMLRNPTIGFNVAMFNCWISYDHRTNIVLRRVDTLEDVVQGHMKMIHEEGKFEIDEHLKFEYMRKRLIQQVADYYYFLEKGVNFAIKEYEFWCRMEMKLEGCNEKVFLSKICPSIKLRYLYNLINTKFGLETAFHELRFQHQPPANNMQTTQLREPLHNPVLYSCDMFSIECAGNMISEKEYKGRLKGADHDGLWKLDIPNGAGVARTCISPVSLHMLLKLVTYGFNFAEKKYFNIEALFKTPVAKKDEFHQVEVVVVGYDVITSLQMVKKEIVTFFTKIGILHLRFQTVNGDPFTESNMEIYSYLERHDAWIKIGNCGIIVPEILYSYLEAPERTKMFAWGISLERLSLLKYE